MKSKQRAISASSRKENRPICPLAGPHIKESARRSSHLPGEVFDMLLDFFDILSVNGHFPDFLLYLRITKMNLSG